MTPDQKAALYEDEVILLKGDVEVNPPLGVMPEDIWVEKRCGELAGAIVRYHQAGKAVPREWTRELHKHNEWLWRKGSNDTAQCGAGVDV